MKRLFLLMSVALFGAGCVSVEVVNKDAPSAEANQVVSQETTTEAVKPSNATSTDVAEDATATTTVLEPVPAAEVTFTDTSLQLEARESAEGVVLTWTRSTVEAFEGYKVVRSEADPLPWYPKSGSVAFVPDFDNTTYLDRGAEHGGIYRYRICGLETDAPPTCGNVITVERP